MLRRFLFFWFWPAPSAPVLTRWHRAPRLFRRGGDSKNQPRGRPQACASKRRRASTMTRFRPVSPPSARLAARTACLMMGRNSSCSLATTWSISWRCREILRRSWERPRGEDEVEDFLEVFIPRHRAGIFPMVPQQLPTKHVDYTKIPSCRPRGEILSRVMR